MNKQPPTWHIANGGQVAKLPVLSIFEPLVPGESNVDLKPPQAICWAVGHNLATTL